MQRPQNTTGYQTSPNNILQKISPATSQQTLQATQGSLQGVNQTLNTLYLISCPHAHFFNFCLSYYRNNHFQASARRSRKTLLLRSPLLDNLRAPTMLSVAMSTRPVVSRRPHFPARATNPTPSSSPATGVSPRLPRVRASTSTQSAVFIYNNPVRKHSQRLVEPGRGPR